jgi:MFS family permease
MYESSLLESTVLTTSRQQGQISGMLVFKDFLRRFGNPDPSAATGYSIPATRSSILVSLMSIGSLLGALSGAYTSDWWGRRKSLTFGVFLFIIGNIIQITSMESWIHMMMGRFVAGIGVGNLSVGELAHSRCFSMKESPSSNIILQVCPCSNPNAVRARSEVP